MHLIYKQAFSIVVWLRLADEYTKDAIEIRNRIGEIPAENLTKSGSDEAKLAISSLRHSAGIGRLLTSSSFVSGLNERGSFKK